MAREVVGQDPQQGGAVFVFANRRASRLKAPWFERNGYCVLHERLHGAVFELPLAGAGSAPVHIDAPALAKLLAGRPRKIDPVLPVHDFDKVNGFQQRMKVNHYDPSEYLWSKLDEQTLADDSDELKELRDRRKEVEEHLREDFGSSPSIYCGGSKSTGTMIKEAYDLDVICCFPRDDDDAGGTLEGIFAHGVPRPQAGRGTRHGWRDVGAVPWRPRRKSSGSARSAASRGIPSETISEGRDRQFRE